MLQELILLAPCQTPLAEVLLLLSLVLALLSPVLVQMLLLLELVQLLLPQLPVLAVTVHLGTCGCLDASSVPLH